MGDRRTQRRLVSLAGIKHARGGERERISPRGADRAQPRLGDQSHVVKLKHAVKVDGSTGKGSGREGRETNAQRRLGETRGEIAGALFMARRIQSNESNLAAHLSPRRG